jgi:type VI secretion system protein ImpF
VATPTQKNDRLAPPLMHAFRVAHQARDATRKIDIREQGDRVIASRRLKARAPIPEAELRRAVNTELVALFNTTNLESIEDLSTAPEVRKSIVNYGFPSLTHRTLDENETSGIAREIETALRDFEPRLLAGSIKARRDDTVSTDELRVRFLVSAALKTQPVELPVQFIAEVELDSGKIKLDRL